MIDSGATEHIINDPKVFSTLLKQETSITGFNNSQTVSEGIGQIKFTTEKGHVIELNDCLLVPSATANLISISKLVNKGADITVNKSSISVIFNGEEILTATLKSGLYAINLTKSKSSLNEKVQFSYQITASKPKTLYDLHVDMGHLSLERLVKLSTSVDGCKIAKSGESLEKVKNCKTCILAKSTNTVLTGMQMDPDSLKMTTFCADITFLEQSKPFGVITHQFSNSTLIKLLDKKSGMFEFFREACIYFKG
jgi:hypothetical protein